MGVPQTLATGLGSSTEAGVSASSGVGLEYNFLRRAIGSPSELSSLSSRVAVLKRLVLSTSPDFVRVCDFLPPPLFAIKLPREGCLGASACGFSALTLTMSGHPSKAPFSVVRLSTSDDCIPDPPTSTSRYV